ncbi:MAG: hypothetical protein ACREVE_12235 [Gammaproteobacteria bacterium]
MINQPLRLHVLTTADIVDADPYSRWDDPDGIAPLSPSKRTALLANPLLQGDREPMQIIGTRGSTIIGRMDLIAGELLVRDRDQPVRMYWGSGLHVPAHARHTMMGIMLIMKAHGVCHTLGAHGPSQVAALIYEKLRWAELSFTRYIMLRRSRAVVEKKLGAGNLGRMVASAVDAGFAVHRSVMRVASWRAAKLRCEPLSSMPPDWDDHFAQRTEPVRVHRSIKWISWVLNHSFVSDPRNRRMLFVVRNARNESLGYFIIKARFYESATHRGFRNLLLGSIMDWMIIEPRALDLHTLVQLAIDQLCRCGVDAIELCTSHTNLAGWLRRQGFVRIGAQRGFFRVVAPSPLADNIPFSSDAWWIRPGDADNLLI